MALRDKIDLQAPQQNSAAGASSGSSAGPSAFAGGRRIFNEANRARFAELYPGNGGQLGHNLVGEPRLALERLATLAAYIAPDRQMYNSAKIPMDMDQADLPPNGLTYVETVKTIAENDSWACLRNAEAHPDYRALIEEALGELIDIIKPRTGDAFRLESDIFVSSPNTVVPLHIDPQHNVLMQISGTKTVHLFPSRDPYIVTPELHERYHYSGDSGLPYNPERDGPREAEHFLGPGDAIYIPVKAPHWVETGDEPSISISVMWRSQWCDRERRIYRVNRALRRMGFKPGVAKEHSALDRVKDLSFQAVERVQRLAGISP